MAAPPPRTVDFLRTPEAWPAETAEGSISAAAACVRSMDSDEYNLDLGSLGLTALPEELGLLGGRVRKFDCSYNPLEALPATIGMLWRLTKLNVAHCQLAALPAKLGGLRWLHTLDCGENGLTDLPALGPRIVNIWCADNKMAAVPPAIRACGRLANLALADNKIKELPGWLDECTDLTTIGVEGCRLVTLPASLGNLEVLDFMNCVGNPLEEPWSGLIAHWDNHCAAIPERLRADARALAAQVKAAR